MSVGKTLRPSTRGAADGFPQQQEEPVPTASPSTAPAERLARRDPPGHPDVGADQPQRGQPAVAPLAAEADGGGDEHGDRQQQHHDRTMTSSSTSAGSCASPLVSVAPQLSSRSPEGTLSNCFGAIPA